MKIFVLFIVTVILSGLVAVADTVTLPETVEGVVSASFSSGSGDDVTHVLSVLCKMKNGRQRLYVLTKVSAGRFFGLGRLANPEFIEFLIKGNEKPVWE